MSAPARSRLLRSALSMSAITLLSRVLGLVREQVRAGYLGTSLASDAFGIAFQLPNLLRRLVAEGAMSAGFIPILSEERERGGDEAAFRFATRYFNLALLTLTVLSTLGVVGAGALVGGFTWLSGQTVPDDARALTEQLTRWMFPYIGLVSLAAVVQGILNTFRVFWVSAFSAVLLNLAMIACAVGLAPRLEAPVWAFVVGVLAGGVLQLVFQVPYVFKLGYRWRPDFTFGPGVRRAVGLLGPTLFGAGIYQVNVVVSQAVAWGIGDGAVSSLQYSGRILELTLGVFAVALSTAVLPSLASDAAADRIDAVRDTLLFAVRLCCFVCFPMTVAGMLLSEETASLLFERGRFGAWSTWQTGNALLFHLIGLTHIAIGRVFVPAFYAFKDTRTPVWTAAVSMAVNLALCYALAPSMAQGGIALANSVSAIAQTALLAWLLRRRVGPSADAETARSVLASALSAGLAAAVILVCKVGFGLADRHGFGALAVPYGVTATLAAATYLGAARALRHPELAEVTSIVRRKLRR